jgi:hypothetical protein
MVNENPVETMNDETVDPNPNQDGEPQAAPDPYALTPENKEKVNSRIEKRLKADRFTRSQFEWEFFRNLCFAAGQHDIVRFRGVVRLRKAPDWYPRTFTNKFAEKYRDLLSALLQGRVPIRYLPATDNPEDQGTADVGERVREVIYSEAKIDSKENELGSWFVLTGNAFLVPYYDYDPKYGEEEVPKVECATCGTAYGAAEVAENDVDEDNPVCPECEEMGVDSALTASPTETELLPIGSLCVDVCSPFEIRGDTRVRDYHDWTWFIRLRRYDSSFAKEKWNYQSADSDNDAAGESTFHYLDVLSQISDSFNPQFGMNAASGGGGDKIPKVTAFEFYELPTADYPEGLCVKRLGNASEGIVELGPLDTEFGAGIRKGKKFLPLAFLGAEVQPGRFWRKSPLSDAIPLQTFRNMVERAIKLEFQRMANSIWLNPKGSGVTQFTGESGQIFTYNPLTLGGTTIAKPERLPPQLNHLQMMVEMLKFIDDAIERVTGTYFLQGGDAPPGVTAASALSLLDERAKKAMSPLVREWAKGFLDFDQIALEIARKHWTDQRIRTICGRNMKYQTASFTSADLQGAVNMDIDYESMFPKSHASEMAEIQQLIQGMVINPQDQQQKFQILKAAGQTKLLGSIDLDIEQAQKEQANFIKGQPPQLVPLVQNSLIHFIEHCDFAKTDEFDELPEQQKDIWYAHIQATCVDMGERRALFAEMQLNPDAPEASEIGTGAAQAAMQGAAQVMGPQTGQPQPGQTMPGTQPGSQAGSGGPSRPSPRKGTTGNGPNQQRAMNVRGAGTTNAPRPQLPDIAASVLPTQ